MRSLSLLMLLLSSSVVFADFSHTGDASLRVDADSAREDRYQYRLRLRPVLEISSSWSVHAFLATGDEFTSAYNTIDRSDDEFHVRRLFGRFETDRGKLELGLIPPFKGRVSSTGLSKEGWIKGARGVINLPRGQLEIVAGELDDLRSNRAMSLPHKLNYQEIEYSGTINDEWSFEIGAERMLDDSFLRGEVRYRAAKASVVALETIRNTDRRDQRWVASVETDLSAYATDLRLFVFYAYSPPDFGQRAELTEDFLDFGHTFSTEVGGVFSSLRRLSWFATLEFYEGRTRLKLGIDGRWQ